MYRHSVPCARRSCQVCVHKRAILFLVTVHQAVRKLREELGDSQQAFATRLGLSIRAIVNYEANRTPSFKSLSLLCALANRHQQWGLVDLFLRAIRKETRTEPFVDEKARSIAMGLRALRKDFKKFCKENQIDSATPGAKQISSSISELLSTAGSLHAIADIWKDPIENKTESAQDMILEEDRDSYGHSR